MSGNSIPISVIILTHRNDARFLKALKSAQFAEEVLIIDHQSHNNWSELKRQYRFKVISIDNTAHRLSLTLKGVKGDGKSEVKSKEKLITKYEIAKEVESEVRLQEKPEKVPEEILKKMNKTTKIVKKVNTKKQKESE